jgi:hypothetical protein
MADFKNLTSSAAYLIWRAHETHVDPQLGKTKLIKMLYMASWFSYVHGPTSLFVGPWYRIDRGPALITGDWDLLAATVKADYGIEATKVETWHGHPQFRFTAPSLRPESDTDPVFKPFLDEVFQEIIPLTADEAASVTYRTEPMLWLVAEERANWGGTMQYRRFSLDDPTRLRFVEIAASYAEGLIDIPEFARLMGPLWTTHQVAVYLDTFGLHRPLTKVRLTPPARNTILRNLANALRGGKRPAHPTVEERAMASARIEGEYFGPDSIIE